MRFLFLFLLFSSNLLLATEGDPLKPLAGTHGRTEDQPLGSDALLREILASHPELAFYEAEIAAAKAGRAGAGALARPEVAVELGRKRVRDVTGAVAGEGEVWSISVTQTFEWPGRLGLRKAIANTQVQLAELGLARFRQALEARARTLLYGLHAAQAKADAVAEVAGRFAALKQTFLAREPAGISPELETRVIEASELALQRRAAEADLEVQAALLELNQLRGASPGHALRVAARPVRFGDIPDDATLVGAARENNFDYRIRRSEIEQQSGEVRLARHERRPSISVSPYASQENAGERESTVGVAVSLPLPGGARGRSEIGVAEARQRQAEIALVVAERELERNVRLTAQTVRVKAEAAARTATNSLQRFREAAELADRHFRLGAVPVGTYVEMQHSYLEAVEALLANERDALEAGLKLQQLTGLTFEVAEVAP